MLCPEDLLVSSPPLSQVPNPSLLHAELGLENYKMDTIETDYKHFALVLHTENRARRRNSRP
jgi:hypothetical protein